MDLSVQKYPGVIAAPLMIGTIAGSGGKFLQDGIQMACGTLHGDYLGHVIRQNALAHELSNISNTPVVLTLFNDMLSSFLLGR